MDGVEDLTRARDRLSVFGGACVEDAPRLDYVQIHEGDVRPARSTNRRRIVGAVDNRSLLARSLGNTRASLAPSGSGRARAQRQR